MNIRHYLPKVIAIAAIAVLAAATSCFAAVLSVPQYNQEKTQWCWDASSQMILYYYGKSVSQTTIANWAVGGQNLPNYLYNSSDWRKDCRQVLAYFGSLSSTGYGYAFSLSTVTSEIDAGRPMMIGWSWTSGGGHAVVIHGTSGSYLYVRDPWYGATVNTYNWVYYARGGSGQWTQTLKLNTNVNPYYAYYQLYMSYANYYASRYYYTHSSSDLYYYYCYSAYAGAYYYLIIGQTSTANRWYYYCMSQAFQALATQYYSEYAHTGTHLYLAYYYYNYAWTCWYYYMYAGNSSYANYFYSCCMNAYRYYLSH